MGQTRNPEARVCLHAELQAEDGKPCVALPNSFPLYRGGSVLDAHIAYESWGTLNAPPSSGAQSIASAAPSRSTSTV